MKIRTFIALEIPEEAIGKIISIRKEKIGDRGSSKWEMKENPRTRKNTRKCKKAGKQVPAF